MARDVIIALCQATGGGLLVAAFAFLVCRAVGKLTAPVRFWLWWLVGAKFLIGFVLAVMGVSALRVHVIQAEHYYTLKGLAKKTVAQAGRTAPLPRAEAHVKTGVQAGKASAAPTANVSQPLAELSTLRISSWRREALRALLSGSLLILSVYLLGLLVTVWRHWGGA